MTPAGKRISKTIDTGSISATTPDQPALPSDPNPLKQDTSKGISPPNNSKDQNFIGTLPLRPALPPADDEMKIVAFTFKNTLQKTWKPAQEEVPRGTFRMAGMFEIRGPTASCILQVQGCYHPVDRTWANIGWKVIRVAKHQQRPRGGP
jgi:hypothetical protein